MNIYELNESHVKEIEDYRLYIKELEATIQQQRELAIAFNNLSVWTRLRWIMKPLRIIE